MITAIVIGCYGAGALIAGRLIFYAVRSDENMAPEDGVDTAMLAVLSFLGGLLWPLAVPVAIVMWHPRKTPAELREQVEARDRRIADLERELGIRS